MPGEHFIAAALRLQELAKTLTGDQLLEMWRSCGRRMSVEEPARFRQIYESTLHQEGALPDRPENTFANWDNFGRILITDKDGRRDIVTIAKSDELAAASELDRK